MDWRIFLYTWQELISAVAGPFLAVVVSAAGYSAKRSQEKRSERKETHRRLEIAMATALNDLYVLRDQLGWIVSRVRENAGTIRSVQDPKVFILDRINYPKMRQIYRDAAPEAFKFRSYYLHNKLLFVDANIKDVNQTAVDFKSDYEEIVRRNEFLIGLMQNNSDATPQRMAYADNLEAFATNVEQTISSIVPRLIQSMVQLKVYNNKLRGKHGYFVWWKNESTRLKYFRTKSDQNAARNNLDSLAAIDAVIDADVKATIDKAEQRAIQLREDYGPEVETKQQSL